MRRALLVALVCALSAGTEALHHQKHKSHEKKAVSTRKGGWDTAVQQAYDALESGSWQDLNRDCVKLKPEACMDAGPCLWDNHTCRAFRPKPVLSGYPHSCNDGTEYADCFDVAACAQDQPGPTASKRWAFVFTHSLEKKLDRLPEGPLIPIRRMAKKWGNTDIVLVVPEPNTKLNGIGLTVKPENFPEESRIAIEKQGVKVRVVPWALPPNMKWIPEVNWCGGKDLLRLHLWDMLDYDVVAYFDTDTQFTGNGDATLPFRCAATDQFVAAAGVFAPLNVGAMWLKPNQATFQAAINFASMAIYDPKFGEGWASAGLAPTKAARGNPHEYPGSECAQGFLHTLLFKSTPEVKLAWKMTGLKQPPANIIDRCIWNFQSERDCLRNEKDVDCSQVVMVHKNGTKCRQHGMPDSE